MNTLEPVCPPELTLNAPPTVAPVGVVPGGVEPRISPVNNAWRVTPGLTGVVGHQDVEADRHPGPRSLRRGPVLAAIPGQGRDPGPRVAGHAQQRSADDHRQMAEAGLTQPRYHLAGEFEMRAGKDREADAMDPLLGALDDLLRRQADAVIDDIHAGVGRAHRNLLGPIGMTVEAGLADEQLQATA